MGAAFKDLSYKCRQKVTWEAITTLHVQAHVYSTRIPNSQHHIWDLTNAWHTHSQGAPDSQVVQHTWHESKNSPSLRFLKTMFCWVLYKNFWINIYRVFPLLVKNRVLKNFFLTLSKTLYITDILRWFLSFCVHF